MVTTNNKVKPSADLYIADTVNLYYLNLYLQCLINGYRPVYIHLHHTS